ncbi:hypothetical protein niasHT_003097 [Heterodera trifolii]|uniref:Uncharacterized protein n=1 Tax=Heterodera trifolii TaxID=157864 RepID=A0ABD2M561_9BILA
MHFSIALLFPVFGPMFVHICHGIPSPFSRDVYPAIDLRLFDWPLAELLPQQSAEDGTPISPISCYTQLDESFVDESRLYRLNNTEQLRGRACLLRIPTGTRFTVERMHTKNQGTFVGVMAGSSQAYFPMWTGRIFEGHSDMYGPWHVQCQNAYLVFNSVAFPHFEWFDFRLARETEEDRSTSNAEDCIAEELVDRGRF